MWVLRRNDDEHVVYITTGPNSFTIVGFMHGSVSQYGCDESSALEDRQEHLKAAFVELEPQSEEWKRYILYAKDWIQQEPIHDEQAAVNMDRMLSHLQQVGIVGPDRCTIL